MCRSYADFCTSVFASSLSSFAGTEHPHKDLLPMVLPSMASSLPALWKHPASLFPHRAVLPFLKKQFYSYLP